VGVLSDYFNANRGRLIHKWLHYFDIYERHFERFRGTDVHVLEIGVYHGGSLQMWKDYFGPRARIFGVDLVEVCKLLEEDQIEIFIGDQGDRGFLRALAARLPRIDILIDDGGHVLAHQIATFEELFPAISPTGVYLCEDLHTSYWSEFGGARGKPGTFIEYSKRLIDQLNAWHSEETLEFAPDAFTRSAHSMHFYDSVLAIEKRPIERPLHLKTGTPSFT